MMTNVLRYGASAFIRQLAVALVAVAVTTLLLLQLPRPLWLPSGSIVYLLAVLVVSTWAGRAAGLIAALASFLSFDWFFTEPRFTLTIREPHEWIALLAYVVVAIVVSELTALQREHLLEAKNREHESRLLHDLTDLLAGHRLGGALAAAAERLLEELGAEAVVIRIHSEDGVTATAQAGSEAAAGVMRAAAPASATLVLGRGDAASGSHSGAPGRWMRIVPPYRATGFPRNAARVPIRRDSRTLGDLSVQWPAGGHIGGREARLLDTVADQLAVATERELLLVRALEAEILRRTNELKSQLLDAVSHDLRTPLAGIIASAGSLRQTDVDWTDEDRAEFASTIEQEAERLNRIVGNLLDLSRIQGGALRPARAWHDPSLLLVDAAERVRSVAGDHRVIVELSPDLEPALIDPVEIDQVVTNLLENALKHTRPGDEVRLTARSRDHILEVGVEDSGPGIPPAAIERLFEPFYRTAQSKLAPGSGLGLAVAKGLVEAHGGRIRAENRPGGGARFVFSIPSPEPPPEATK
jgi:two-component system sensor histidine kinase KdpD